MPAINEITKSKIQGYLEALIEGAIEDTTDCDGAFVNPQSYLSLKSAKPELKPFHAAIIPDELMIFSNFERHLKASLKTAFERCAYYIALDHHTEVHHDYSFSGYVSSDAIREVERQALRFHQARDENDALPSLDEMIGAVLDARDDEEKFLKVAQTGLYIRAHNGSEYYFDIKSPKPNKDQCQSMIYQILYYHLIRGLPRPKLQSSVVFAYNPYGNTRQNYRWSTAKMYLPFEQAILIGDEFWNFIGGETTYVELLKIYAEVGRVKSERIIESLTQSWSVS